MAFDTATGWLTFLHRAHDLRRYRYEMVLEDGQRAFATRENRTTYFGAIADRRIWGKWDRNDGLPLKERDPAKLTSEPEPKQITAVFLYDADTDGLVDWYEDGKWQQWEDARASRKEVEQRNNWKMGAYQIGFWTAAGAFIWAANMTAGSYAGVAAGALAIMISLAMVIDENVVIASQDAMFLLPR